MSLQEFEPNGYNPSTGIYVSREIFTGNWENEIEALDFTPRTKLMTEDADLMASDKAKGIQDNYLYNTFKSANGQSNFHDQLNDFWKEELPEDYSYTDSYHNSPKLAAIIDYFQVEKSRCRIFQQQPGVEMPVHTDFDNQKGTEGGETVRIFVQLNDMPGGAWFRCKTADSDVTVNLQKGQFLVFYPDATGHGTCNVTDIPRNTYMLVCKRNAWIDSLGQDKEASIKFVDIDAMVEEKTAELATA
jgi:hypothetical protein